MCRIHLKTIDETCQSTNGRKTFLRRSLFIWRSNSWLSILLDNLIIIIIIIIDVFVVDHDEIQFQSRKENMKKKKIKKFLGLRQDSSLNESPHTQSQSVSDSLTLLF